MRLKPFLYSAGLDEARFTSLRRHDNLPFATDPQFTG